MTLLKPYSQGAQAIETVAMWQSRMCIGDAPVVLKDIHRGNTIKHHCCMHATFTVAFCREYQYYARTHLTVHTHYILDGDSGNR